MTQEKHKEEVTCCLEVSSLALLASPQSPLSELSEKYVQP